MAKSRGPHELLIAHFIGFMIPALLIMSVVILCMYVFFVCLLFGVLQQKECPLLGQ